MSTTRFFSALFISFVLSIVLPLSALAQTATNDATDLTPPASYEADTSQPSAFTLVAATEVQNALFERQDENVFTIGFDLTNTVSVQTDVSYAFFVFEEMKGTSTFGPRVLADSKIYDETLTLTEGATVHKSIQYTPPSFLKGNYDVWVFAFNRQSSFLIGQTRVGTITFLGTGEKTQLTNCMVMKKGDTEGATRGPTFVSLGETLSARCTVENTAGDMSVTPVLELRARSSFGKTITTERLSALSLSRGANILTFDIPAQASAGVWNAVIALTKDDQDISNETTIPYATDGTTGVIQNALFDKVSYAKGDTAKVSLFFTTFRTSTDADESPLATSLSATLTDYKGKSCAEPFTGIFTKGEQTTDATFSITRPCEDPRIAVTLADGAGTTLDTATFTVDTGKEDTTNYPLIIVLVALIVLALGFFLWNKKRGTTQPPRSMVGMAGVFLAIALFGGWGVAEGATLSNPMFMFWGKFDPNMFVDSTLNVNLDKGNYAPGENIAVSWSLYTDGTCCGKFLLNNAGYGQNFYTKLSAIINGQTQTGQVITINVWQTTISGVSYYTAPSTAGNYTAEIRGTYGFFDSGNEGVNDCYGPGGCGNWFPYRSLFIPYAVTAPVIPPTVSLTASPNPVDYNTNSTFNWSSSNATSCKYTIDGGASWASVALSGSTSGGPFTSAVTVTLECSGAGGTAQTSVTVTIKPPAVSLTASPSSVSPGGSSTLSWSPTASALGLTSCTASGGTFTGTKPTSGSESTGPLSATTAYSINCTGPAGSASASATVTVVVPPPVPTVTISASPTTVPSGTASTLTWSSTSATSCTASNGWTGPKATSGSQSTGPLTTGKTYTLTCTNATGSAVASATVSIGAAPPAPTVTLTASPTSVPYNTASTLTWTPTNATSCTATGGTFAGSKSVSGGTQTTGNLIANTTYSITCSGITSPSGTASVTVTVGVAPPPLPTVSFSAAPNPVNYNTSSTLTWSSTNADSCTASGAWTGSKAVSGSQATGNLIANQAYTLTCTNVTGSANRSVTVSVNPPTPDFTLAKSNNIEVTIVGGVPSVSSKSTVTVLAVGSFANAIDLSVVSISPAIPGITYSLSNPNLTTGEYASGSLFSVTVPGTTVSGTSVITIQGIGGGLTRTVNILLTIFGKDPEFENF